METAIQTVVKVFLKSAKGKESLGKKEFQNLVSSQLGNILSVRIPFTELLWLRKETSSVQKSQSVNQVLWDF